MTKDRSLFPDSALIDFVTEVYGPKMGRKIEETLGDMDFGKSGFAESLRRSLSNEYASMIEHGIYLDAMRDG